MPLRISTGSAWIGTLIIRIRDVGGRMGMHILRFTSEVQDDVDEAGETKTG